MLWASSLFLRNSIVLIDLLVAIWWFPAWGLYRSCRCAHVCRRLCVGMCFHLSWVDRYIGVEWLDCVISITFKEAAKLLSLHSPWGGVRAPPSPHPCLHLLLFNLFDYSLPNGNTGVSHCRGWGWLPWGLIVYITFGEMSIQVFGPF